MDDTKINIYMFCEMPRLLRAKSILDVGMYLERMGAVSRAIGGGVIAEDVYFCGLEESTWHMPVTETVYNKIFSLSNPGNESFDAVVCINIKDRFDRDDIKEVLENHAKVIIADKGSWDWLGMDDSKYLGDYVGKDDERFAVARKRNE
ncbi:MAG: hypothetical protein K6G40_09015 [Eubacterium sp.]|nr:hypothetical protein [Eubacterium sp.]